MPELPEVETCRRSLDRWTRGRRVDRVEFLDGRSVRDRREDRPSAGSERAAMRVREFVTGQAPVSTRRHGKRLLWTWPRGCLLLHLGMTGKWTRLPSPFEKLRLYLDDGSILRFADPRLLGGVVPCSHAEGPQWLAEGLGPDAWAEPLPQLTGSRPIKVALMDQSRVAGLGNLHAAEALWRAGIDPRCPASDTSSRHDTLAEGVREQLRLALDELGTSDEITYVEEAGAANPFPVYQREGEPCPRCGAGIARLFQGGRSTYWCPGCQR